jgi:chromate transporter
MRNIRNFIFLKDVFILAITSFGGAQAHFAIILDRMVKLRAYLTEEELIELHALCNLLPGPTSTQTITAIGFKRGGPPLAYLTLLVWILPAVTVMTAAAILINSLQVKELSLHFTRFIQPMAIAFVAYSAVLIWSKVIKSRTSIFLAIGSAVISYFISSPYLFPVLLLAGGVISSTKYKRHEKEERQKINIVWANFFLWAGVLIFAALLGAATKYQAITLPIRLFENFYRNGSLIFGGGQVLVPFLYTEFVEFKSYLSSEEFLSGYALVQAIPGPTFSFSAFIGALTMREWGTSGEIMGAVIASVGVFLPGTFLIFFVSRFWDQLKKYRPVKASLEGINAASAGMVVAAAFLLYQPLEQNLLNILVIIITFLVLQFTKMPRPIIILIGFALGFVFKGQ